MIKQFKTKTRWKNWKNNPILGERLFNDELGGFFKITKIQSCKEYCKSATTPDGSHWFTKDRAFITTDTGLKYIVPYLWVYLTSVDEKGKFLKR